MNLEFKIYELKEDSKEYKRIIQETSTLNEFIVVGEELVGGEIDCFKMHQMEDDGLKLIGGLDLKQSAYLVDKKSVRLQTDGLGYNCIEINIPKEYLTLDIIEDIQRLNE